MTTSLIPPPLFRKKVRQAEIRDGFALVPLTQGYFAKVDLPDLHLVADRNWQASSGGAGRIYASAYYRIGPKKYGRILMHRLILGLVEDKPEVDHWDGDSLHNCRSNLRVCTISQNRANRGACKHNKLGIKGVYYRPDRQVYRAEIRAEGRSHYLGAFATASEASAAYDAAALRLFGEFAALNETRQEAQND
jgi:hypothetical protein